MFMIIQNKYRIDDLLDQGSFGVVFKGTKIKNNTPVAIKINHHDFNTIKHEATILNYLQSKKCHYIPLVHYYGFVQNKCVLVMPYYDYSLTEILGRDNSNCDPKSLFFQSLRALENIHQHDIIHRDIKEDNILVKNNKIYLIDFGWSVFRNEDYFLTPREISKIPRRLIYENSYALNFFINSLN